MIARAAELIDGQGAERVIRVGVDGVNGAGKTIFADELAGALRARGRDVLRASIDDFHQPSAIRYRLGRNSPDGYFLDSFNYVGLREALLTPLGPGGSGLYRTGIFDLQTDRALLSPVQQADPDSVLVFDGVFLHCPELRRSWEFSIFLDVGFEVSVARIVARDGLDAADPQAPENRRYVEGQKRYLAECKPRDRANLVIANTDVAAPSIVTERA